MKTLIVLFLLTCVSIVAAVWTGQQQWRMGATGLLFLLLGGSVHAALAWSKRASENDPESPIVVAKRGDEMQAAVVVDHLKANGINAVAVGTFTSGFQVEIASMVKIVVPRQQADEAIQLLASKSPDVL